MFTGFGPNDLTARHKPNEQPYGTVTGNAAPGAKVYPGIDAQTSDPVSATPVGLQKEGDGFQLNFEAADAAAVCKTILGDILQANYAIDPRVTGQITLSSARPVPKTSLINLLETALKSINASIVHEGPLYRVVPVSEAAGTGLMEFGTASDGFGTTVIPVRYVSVQTIGRILENFATRPGAVKVDAAANMIVVQGTSQERRSAIDTAATIDTDMMRERSVGIFPLTNSSPDAVIPELNKILETGEGGVGQNQVELQPMTRMNGILVVARNKNVLDAVTRWIRRLDAVDPSVVGVKVYRLRYAQAKNVASMLNDIMSGRSSSTSQADQEAPQPAQSSSTSLLSKSPASAPAPSTQPTATTTASTPGTQTQNSQSSGLFGPASNAPANDTTNPNAAAGPGSASSTKVRITADVTNNSLLIIAGPQDYRIVEQAIRELDRPPVQVAIEATIAEVTLTDQLQYGVQAYLHSNDVGITPTDKGTISLSASSAASAAISATVPGANLILGPASNPRVVLNALHALTNVKVLSSPSLVVLDNQQATLQVGDQVAIETQSSVSTASSSAPVINSIDYKDTGIILRVSPHVHANGIVNLEVEQEISSVVDNTGGANGLTPTISQRRVKSSIVVSSGQTVLLAGLISENQSSNKNTIPGVEQWKWLSNVLSNNNSSTTRTELIIFIKPKIMRDQADAQAVSEEFRDRMTSMQPGPAPARRLK